MRSVGPICLYCFVVAGCASAGAVPEPFPRPHAAAPEPALIVPNPGGGNVVEVALSLQGAPYRDGGADPTGFDCSGFVAYVFALQGVNVPRTVAEQARAGDSISRGAVNGGDLVFFTTTQRGPSHVGIAISPEEFIHAPTSAGVVRVESLGSPYWSRRFAGARRIR